MAVLFFQTWETICPSSACSAGASHELKCSSLPRIDSTFGVTHDACRSHGIHREGTSFAGQQDPRPPSCQMVPGSIGARKRHLVQVVPHALPPHQRVAARGPQLSRQHRDCRRFACAASKETRPDLSAFSCAAFLFRQNGRSEKLGEYARGGSSTDPPAIALMLCSKRV